MENLRRHFPFSGHGKGTNPSDVRSTFHVKVQHEQNPENSNITGAGTGDQGFERLQENIVRFIHSLSQYHGAGTHLREELSSTLKGTLYEPLGAMCTTKLPRDIMEGRPDLLQMAKEIERLLAGIKEKTPKTEASQQTILRCMLLLMKLEYQYHQMCLQEVSSSLRDLTQICTNHNCHDILQHMASLGLANHSSPHMNNVSQYHAMSEPPGLSNQISCSIQDGVMPTKDNKGVHVNDMTKLPPKQASKASFFSLFGRKSSHEEVKNNGSSFYVDIKQDNGNIMNPSSSVLSSHQLHVDTGSGLSLAVTPPSGSSDTSSQNSTGAPDRLGAIGSYKSPGPKNGQLASEEELDSVINLLSGYSGANSSNGGSSRTSPQMQSIPEDKVAQQLLVPTQAVGHPGHSPLCATSSAPPGMAGHIPTGVCPAPGVLTQIPVTVTVTKESDSLLKPPPRTQLHRRSEGSIDFNNVGNYHGNTWPNQHRASLPISGPLLNQQGFYDAASLEQHGARRYSSDLQVRSRGYYGNQLLSYGPQWTFPDSKLNNVWPAHSSHASSQASGLATAGSDTMTSSWSGIQDSSDLSDDSSSGEQFFAVGLDLVHALDSKNDSSDDEFEGRAFSRNVKDQRPRSLENLLDVKSTNTWPPKQPWARSALVISEAVEASVVENQHRPLQMQWSDPMSSRNPIWGTAGLGPQAQLRNMHGFGPLPQ